jgi:hypothetical protein
VLIKEMAGIRVARTPGTSLINRRRVAPATQPGRARQRTAPLRMVPPRFTGRVRRAKRLEEAGIADGTVTDTAGPCTSKPVAE